MTLSGIPPVPAQPHLHQPRRHLEAGCNTAILAAEDPVDLGQVLGQPLMLGDESFPVNR